MTRTRGPIFTYVLIVGLLLFIGFVPLSRKAAAVRLGSKKFSESVVLGEVLTQLARSTGARTQHLQEIGGTQIVFGALKNGEIDAYVEYTGTIDEEILSSVSNIDDAKRKQALEKQGVEISAPLGFSNSYALAMRRAQAEELQIDSVSQLAKHLDLRFGFTNEFMDRPDGWPGLSKHYALAPESVTGLDHDIAYRQIKQGDIDVMDAFTTDAKVAQLDLKALADDRSFFPRYQAVILARADLRERKPEVAAALDRLVATIDEAQMMKMNSRVELDGDSEAIAAAEFLNKQFDLQLRPQEQSRWQRIWRYTLEHLELVRRSLIPAILIAIPLGIAAAKLPRFGQVILAVVGIIQTIPALALLVLLMPLSRSMGWSSVGPGPATAVMALFLYSLLPIVRNTAAGLDNISKEYLEAATALGLSPLWRLHYVELPLALRTILAGIKTAAVINVGFATLGALIGAGGYGQPILTGIRLDRFALILEGAVPAAVLAIVVQIIFELIERVFVPRGLRATAND